MRCQSALVLVWGLTPVGSEAPAVALGVARCEVARAVIGLMEGVGDLRAGGHRAGMERIRVVGDAIAAHLARLHRPRIIGCIARGAEHDPAAKGPRQLGVVHDVAVTVHGCFLESEGLDEEADQALEHHGRVALARPAAAGHRPSTSRAELSWSGWCRHWCWSCGRLAPAAAVASCKNPSSRRSMRTGATRTGLHSRVRCAVQPESTARAARSGGRPFVTPRASDRRAASKRAILAASLGVSPISPRNRSPRCRGDQPT